MGLDTSFLHPNLPPLCLMRALKKSLTLLQNVGGYETSKLSMFALYRRWPKLSIITGVGALIQARNIDTTTFSNLPVVTTTETLFVISSTNVAARYTRVGNVVFAFVNITCPSIAAHDGTSVSTGGVPDGYKPAGRAVMSGGAVSGGSSTGNFSIIIDPDNTRTIWNGFTTSNNTRLQLIGTWVTNDAWPSS